MRLRISKRRSLSTTVFVVLATAFAVVAAACAPHFPPPANSRALRSPAPVGSIAHVDRWLVDSTGRVVMPRGVNFVMKNAPYYPAAAGFNDDDATWIAQNGFEAVRLGFTATGLMPTPGVIDQQLLARIGQTVDVLTRHGLYVLLDLHQDGWGERANGEPLGSDGFPEWMTLTRGATNTHTGFPLYYVTNPAIQAEFQSLWDNDNGPDGLPLQSQVATMFGALAAKFGSNPRVLGYDVFNEPWPGTNTGSCLSPGCPDLDHAWLDPLYAQVNTAVRAHDRKHIVFGEPFVLFNFGPPTAMSLPGNDARNGMSFHMYTATPTAEPTLVQHALDWAASTKGALLNTEWGATTDTAAITRQADELDGALIPWMYWSYDEEIVPNLHETPGGTNLTPQASAIIRPHAVVIAGTPSAMHFDAATKAFDFSWSTTRAGGGHFAGAAVTSVSLPPLVYPDGYTVTATNARVTSKPCASTLTLVASPHAQNVSVHVTPGGDCGH